MNQPEVEKLGTAHIDYGNSHVSISADIVKEKYAPDGWLELEVSTGSYGDHSSSISFSVNKDHAKSLRKMAELLFAAANYLEK